MDARSFTLGFNRRMAWAALALVPWLAPGCGKHDDHAPASSGHAHQPQNGGQLLEVGKHQFNIEVLVDASKGKVTAWILDAHAEDYVRIPAPALRLSAVAGGQPLEVTLAAVANPASGERVGDTSQFEGAAEWLKTTPAFSGTFHDVSIRGAAFGNVPFQHGPVPKAH